MATYKQIQEYIKENYNVSIKTCWIADMKEYHGFKKRIASNRISKDSKIYSCPDDKKEMITDAFKFFKII